ncbi:hypothetical protein ACFQ1E_13210 [Sphingomonas canadensis]|uniref:Uncharacterized protein n=1 Tax=Sphingomonas canadensis TaxID=1219257 RepID=A0ABW3HCR9_9SPHN|nr:hypothetical protein [Sphingomonas canadensis]MCW3837043.1 hypothetical protein [Sphingomonas canadensis]
MNDPLRHAWQASGDAALPPIDRVRAGADRFHRIIRRRNRVEYAACAFVILFFGLRGLTGAGDPVTRAGALLVVLGTLVVAWQLHRRAPAVAPPAAAALEPVLVHQRAQLARQHAALLQVGRWYILPLVPGMALMMLAPALIGGLGAMPPFQWVAIAISTAIFGMVWRLNIRAARGLERAIADLDALAAEQ